MKLAELRQETEAVAMMKTAVQIAAKRHDLSRERMEQHKATHTQSAAGLF
jgi:hypothetical protein